MATTEKGRRTRQRIIEATGEQILAAGIGGTTLETVRAATLTSKSQLFHYFPGGKTELVREVAVWEGEQLLAAQEPEIHDLGSWGSWRRWRDGLVDYYLGQGRWACPIGSLATEAAAADPDTASLITTSMTAWKDALAAGVRRMQEAGEVDPDADADLLATGMVAALQGGIVLSQPERSGRPLEAVLDQILDPLLVRATARAGSSRA
ncbi:TetR/AcrR family transcriptional regulator [Actinomycetospora straminea]|uniref:TetR/AcrR family transcriptional regulator n=1 Tax=Actinomycetospora straminea TaxID=663607 RepID=A0ABP9E9X9_9PSEU|nr:TetR/AcrR family transcriptional regulator [Actinomycetospora straminea]MDD7934597.1 TetR/AcrR family transcriptional regulator [Actinomycetospora straminea]